MKITFNAELKRFEASFDKFLKPAVFAEATTALRNAGFIGFDPAKKCRYTTSAQAASRFAEYLDDAARAQIAGTVQLPVTNLIAASKATEGSGVEIPVPNGLAYLPYQKAGIEFAASKSGVLIADEMGLGKTIQGIGVINANPNTEKVLVIVPASLKINWKRELEKWLVNRNLSIEIANGHFPNSNIVIINYEQLKKYTSNVRSITWDILIADEAHYLKNSKAQRTKEVFGDYKNKLNPISANRKVFLTGTPILNRPKELWTIANALDNNGLGRNWKYYHERYCAGFQDRYGWQIDGCSNAAELQTRLRSTFMIRRLKTEVLKELPRKVRQVIRLNCEGDAKDAVEKENQKWDAINLEKLMVAVEVAKASENPADYEDAVATLRAAKKVAFTEMSKVRHETAVAKVPAVIEYLTDALENGEKIVCFAHHQDVIESIANAFPEISVIFHGGIEQSNRQAAVDAFQKNPKIKLFVASIEAAGVGITLTAASNVIFAELSYVPGKLQQAEDRCHRIGQSENVLVQHLVLDGSLDVKMADDLIAKQKNLFDCLDRELSGNDYASEDNSQVTIDEGSAATAKVTPKEIAEEAEQIPGPCVALIHQGLKQLAGLDGDYASSKNDIGFSKVDTAFGHILANAPKLSPKMAAIGLRLIHKYRKQLPGLAAEVKEIMGKLKFLENL